MAARGPARGRGGRGRGGVFATMQRYRLHLGETPTLVMPSGAFAVRLTHIEGVSFPEFAFSRTEAGDPIWVTLQEVPARQHAAFSRNLRVRAATLTPPIDEQSLIEIGTSDRAALWAADHSQEWWRAHLPDGVYRRIFPARAQEAP